MPIQGGELPANAPARFFFSEYLAPEGLELSATLSSGTLALAASVAYDPVERALVVLPSAPLRPGLGYSISIAGVQGLSGQALSAPYVLSFRAGVAEGERASADVRFGEIAPLLRARCERCHDQARPPELTWAGLVEVRAGRQPEWALVAPSQPLASYLILRLLPDYPGVHGPTMPPDGSLTEDEARLMVDWVRSGARP